MLLSYSTVLKHKVLLEKKSLCLYSLLTCRYYVTTSCLVYPVLNLSKPFDECILPQNFKKVSVQQAAVFFYNFLTCILFSISPINNLSKFEIIAVSPNVSFCYGLDFLIYLFIFYDITLCILFQLRLTLCYESCITWRGFDYIQVVLL